MAQVQIKRAHHPVRRVWVTALILFAAASLAWLLLGTRGAREEATFDLTAAAPPPGPVVATARDAVGEYVRYTAAHRARMDADHTHEYTAEGIRRLAGALAALAARDARGDESLRVQADALRDRADALQRDPQSTTHARQAREAFVAAAGLIDALSTREPSARSEAAPTSAPTSDVLDAAMAVEPTQLLLRQRDAIQRFFDSASAAVQAMVPATQPAALPAPTS